MVDMISISSLAQRFRPRPAVLPPSSAITSVSSAQQQQQQPTTTNLLTSTLALAGTLGSSRSCSSQGDASSNLVGDPVLGGPSHSRFSSQDSAFGTFPMHVLTPIVSSAVDSIEIYRRKLTSICHVNR